MEYIHTLINRHCVLKNEKKKKKKNNGIRINVLLVISIEKHIAIIILLIMIYIIWLIIDNWLLLIDSYYNCYDVLSLLVISSSSTVDYYCSIYNLVINYVCKKNLF